MKFIESMDCNNLIAVDKIESLKIYESCNGIENRLVARMVSGDEIELFKGMDDAFDCLFVCREFLRGYKSCNMYGKDIVIDIDNILYLDNIWDMEGK